MKKWFTRSEIPHRRSFLRRDGYLEDQSTYLLNSYSYISSYPDSAEISSRRDVVRLDVAYSRATDFNKPFARATASCSFVAQYPLSGSMILNICSVRRCVCTHARTRARTHVWVSRAQEKVHRSGGKPDKSFTERSRKSRDPIVRIERAVLYNAASAANKERAE